MKLEDLVPPRSPGGELQSGSSQTLEEQLDLMSDEELRAYEDQLMLEAELTSVWKIRGSAGRAVLFVLSAAFWGVYMLIAMQYSKTIPSPVRPLFDFAAFFVTLILGGATASLLWKTAGIAVRCWIRSLLHYWPLTIATFVAALVLMSGKS